MGSFSSLLLLLLFLLSLSLSFSFNLSQDHRAVPEMGDPWLSPFGSDAAQDEPSSIPRWTDPWIHAQAYSNLIFIMIDQA